MKDLRCLLGRHEWKTKKNREGELYEVCGRTNCLKIRKTGSPFDADGGTPNTRSQAPWYTG
jgi:hypothetical protein